MTDYNELAGKAKAKGLSLRELAQRIGISKNAMYNKSKGRTDFRGREIQAIQKELELSDAELHSIFFN